LRGCLASTERNRSSLSRRSTEMWSTAVSSDRRCRACSTVNSQALANAAVVSDRASILANPAYPPIPVVFFAPQSGLFLSDLKEMVDDTRARCDPRMAYRRPISRDFTGPRSRIAPWFLSCVGLTASPARGAAKRGPVINSSPTPPFVMCEVLLLQVHVVALDAFKRIVKSIAHGEALSHRRRRSGMWGRGAAYDPCPHRLISTIDSNR